MDGIVDVMYSSIVIVMVLIFGGLIIGFAGYKLFRLYSAVVGFAVGVILGYYISLIVGYSFLTYFGTGVIMAIVFWLLYDAGLFLTGAVIGYMFLNALLPEKMLYSYVFAVLCGILVLFLERALIIILTAFLGSTAIVVAVEMLVTGIGIEAFLFDPRNVFAIAFSSPLMFLLWFVLGIIGIITQIILTKETAEY